MDIQIYRRFFKGKHFLVCGLILVIGIGVLLNGISPYVFGNIIDRITAFLPGEFKRLLLLYLIICVMTLVLSIVESMIGTYVVNSIQNEMQKKLLDRMLVLKCHESDKAPEGELFNRLEFDADSIVSYYIDLISSILMIIVNLLISLYFIFHISKGLSGMVVIAIPVLYLINFISRRQIQRFQKSYKVYLDGYYEIVNWLLRHLQFIKIFQIEKKINDDYQKALKEKIKLEMRGAWLTNKVGGVRGLVAVILNTGILFCAGLAIMKGQMSIGNMVAFHSYLSKLLEACSKLLELNLDKQKVRVCYERIQELDQWEKEELKWDGLGVFEAVGKIQKIELRNVCFSHGGKRVLQGLNLRFDAPGLYTITGENGCGKTTILKLLERLYDCAEGEILINQKKIEEYDLHCLRSCLAYMAKEPFFTKDTIMNNLRIGTSGVTEDDVFEICKWVGIHDDIVKLEKGYQTMMESQGKNFSSGQKQKFGFARALLQKAQVYLLDEVTSDLDCISRDRIWQIILKLAEEHIVINITHYAEHIDNSKKIFVLSEG